MASRAIILISAFLAVCWTVHATRPLIPGAASDGTSGIMEAKTSTLEFPGRKLNGIQCTVSWDTDSCDIHSASDISCGDEEAAACCYDTECCSRASGGGGTCPDDADLACCSGKKKKM